MNVVKAVVLLSIKGKDINLPYGPCADPRIWPNRIHNCHKIVAAVRFPYAASCIPLSEGHARQSNSRIHTTIIHNVNSLDLGNPSDLSKSITTAPSHLLTSSIPLGAVIVIHQQLFGSYRSFLWWRYHERAIDTTPHVYCQGKNYSPSGEITSRWDRTAPTTSAVHNGMQRLHTYPVRLNYPRTPP
jgi:hypothetical protein